MIINIADREQVAWPVPDQSDLRDLRYRPTLQALPPAVLPKYLGFTHDELFGLSVRNQGDSIQCTGYALASYIDYLRLRAAEASQARNSSNKPQAVEPVSAKMLFRAGEKIARGEMVDPFAPLELSIRATLKGFYHGGVCSERLWPDKGEEVEAIVDVTPEIAHEARKISLGAYYRLEHFLSDYHSAVYEAGAILVSAGIHQGWSAEEVRANQRIKQGSGSSGLHAFLIVGYDATGFFVLNSWGRGWSGRIAGTDAISPGVSHWSYEDWSISVADAWVIRLGVSTPHAFAHTRGPKGSGVMRGGATSASIPRQEVVGHYVQMSAGRYVDTGSYPSSAQSLQQTLAIISAQSRNRKPRRNIRAVYLRIAGDSGGIDSSMEVVTRLRRQLKPKGIYPISVLWATSLSEAFSVAVEGCMARVVARTSEPSDSRNRLIERSLRPLGEPLWQQLRSEAKLLANGDSSAVRDASPLYMVYQSILRLKDEEQSDPQAEHCPVIVAFEGTAVLVFLELLLALSIDQIDRVLSVTESINIVYPVVDAIQFRDVVGQAMSSSPTLREKLKLIYPDPEWFKSLHVGTYTKSWFELVSASFEPRHQPNQSVRVPLTVLESVASEMPDDEVTRLYGTGSVVSELGLEGVAMSAPSPDVSSQRNQNHLRDSFASDELIRVVVPD